MLRYRLRQDFQLAIITLFGACATLGIVPYAVYRFISGNALAGFIDSAIVLSIFGAVLHAWRSDTTRVAAWLIAVTTTIGCMAIAIVLGLPGLFWMYAVVLSNSLLLRSTEAALLMVLALAGLAIHGGAFTSTLELVMFAVTLSLVSLFAFIFAYRSEQQRSQLQALARHDALTGACNRLSMQEELQLAMEMSRRDRRPWGLVVLDLDHFKRINDRYGHAEGDKVLIELVRLIGSTTRKSDRLFRYGGEEFVLLFPGADSGALRPLVEKLRSCIGESLQSHGEKITVSIGAAALQPDEPWEAWMARADAAMYQAKRQGRDRSVVADDAIATGIAAAQASAPSNPA